LIEGTVMAWAEVMTSGLRWHQERDTPRIRQAFVTLASTRRTWPAPADFLEALPRHEPLKAIPAHVSDPEKARAVIEALAKELKA
jgi:hypothetical protein